jgi:predicted HTH transcriptional regulator
MALDKPLEEVNADDLRGLVHAAVPELRTMEYKSAVPGRGDEDKREFLADVSSLANSAGGHLIFGMGADEGLPIDVTGVDLGSTVGSTSRAATASTDRKSPA